MLLAGVTAVERSEIQADTCLRNFFGVTKYLRLFGWKGAAEDNDGASPVGHAIASALLLK